MPLCQGEVLWKRDDYYAQHSISSLYAGVPLGPDGYCVRGYQSWEVADGWYSGERVILHLDDRGNIVSYFVYPPAQLHSASFDMLFVDPSTPDKAFLVIALDDLYAPAGWALLPAVASVLPPP